MANHNEQRPNRAKPHYPVDNWRIILRVSPEDDETVLNPGEAPAFQRALISEERRSAVDPFGVVAHEGHYFIDFFIDRAAGEAAIGECAMRASDAIEAMKLPAKVDRAAMAPQRDIRREASTLEAYNMRLEDVTQDVDDWLDELHPDESTMDAELNMLLFDES